MRGKKWLLLVLPGLLLAIYPYIATAFSFSRPGSKGAVLLVNYRRILLDPPPLKVHGVIVVPAGRFLGSNSVYLPLSHALELLGLSSADRSSGDLKVPVWGNDSSGQSHYRYYPVYNLKARLEPEDRRIEGRLFLAYQNPYFYPLRDLQFNLPAGSLAGVEGGLAVHQVWVNREEAPFQSQGSRLLVPLPRPLLPQETVAVEMAFSTRLPMKAARLGFFEGVTMASGWYPLLAPRQKGVWQGMADGVTFGDPYFSDAAYYTVDLEAPAGQTVVASGRLISRGEKSGRAVWSFTSEHPIREFAFAAAPDWQLLRRKVGLTELVWATRHKPSPAVEETAAQALSFFQDYFGTYPFSYLYLAEVPLQGLAGMEYPGLIFLSSLENYGSSVVVHEVAHQWWYNLVGNDSIRAAWIDEGLAEYSTMLFYREVDPDFYRQREAALRAEGGAGDLPEEKPLTGYASEEEYRRAVYRQGALFWLDWEGKMGRESLQEALRYVQEYYRFERIEASTLKQILEFYREPQKYLAPWL
ncbi:MAG: M1 family aminopeptidase [Moorellaceae bacterium]